MNSCIITTRNVIIQQKYSNYRLVMYNKKMDVACICYGKFEEKLFVLMKQFKEIES